MASRRFTRTAGAVGLLALLTACVDAPVEPSFSAPGEEGGQWSTWVLSQGDEVRPPPPDLDATQAELDEVLRRQAERTAEEERAIVRWDGAPTGEWTEITVDLIDRYVGTLPRVRVASPVHASRTAVLLHVAIHDALVAAWSAKYAYQRPPPHEADERVVALSAAEPIPTYPSEHAAAASAAAVILPYAFPHEDPETFEDLAREVGDSRVVAGVAYPSDVEAGMELGRAVAERVLEYAERDGSDVEWDETPPPGGHVWQPTPPRMVEDPYDPLAGQWRTWVLSSGDQFRLLPPPQMGSLAFEANLTELRAMPDSLTAEQVDAALYWATSAPSMRWHLITEELIREHSLSSLHAARVHALTSIAMYDAYIACWDAKYRHWLLRPITADPEIETVFPTPPFPAYPSGHSTISVAAAEVLAYLFPEAAENVHWTADVAAESRVWGGVHYRFDSVAGKALGRWVGQAVVAHARSDGSRP